MSREKILFVASEAVPFIKTGGLADVAGTLPKYFDHSRYDVRVILPKYSCIKPEWKDRMEYVTHFYMPLAWRSEYVGVMKIELDGVTFYFIDNEHYFTGDKPYGEARGDIEKFSYFSKAALSCLPALDFRPDIIHCHDWQAALVPVYLNDGFQDNPFYQGIKTIMTIHNLKFQGVYDKTILTDIMGLSDSYFAPDKLEAYKDANMLKGGIVYADRVTTVSDTYAEEIKTPFYGEKLEGLLQARSNVLSGIVNGIDYDIFNPETDKALAAPFNAGNHATEKVKNKLALQRELGLTEDPNVMLIGMVSRLTDQKGFDLVAHVFDELCQDAVQFVILGTGDEKYENMFREFAWRYPGKVSANIYYSDPLSHKIYGSCDAFLMPSLFEPCGLSQIMSLRYGTVPIVRETGGLKDTVLPYNEYENTGLGFTFANYNAHEMMATVRYAEKVFYDTKEAWNALVKRAMEVDYSWSASAEKYEILYDNLIGWYWPRGEQAVEAPAVEEAPAAPVVEAAPVAQEAPVAEKKPAKKAPAKKPAAKKAPAKKEAKAEEVKAEEAPKAKKTTKKAAAKAEEKAEEVEAPAEKPAKKPAAKKTTKKADKES